MTAASSPRTWIVDPLDTVFFRQGRAFQPGDAADVRSVFPPPPATIQGLARSKLLADHCGRWITYRNGCRSPGGPCEHEPFCEVQSVVGRRTADTPSASDLGSLRIRGPWLLIGTQPLLPVPADIVADERLLIELRNGLRTDLETTLLTPRETTERNASMPGTLRPLEPVDSLEKFATPGGWMTWPTWIEYLQGDAPVLTCDESDRNWWNDESLWATELRPGVTIEAERNRAKDHNLYFAQHVRMAPHAGRDGQRVRLAFECDGVPDGLMERLATYPVCAAGGEMRAAIVSTDAAPPWTQAPDSVAWAIKNRQRSKIVLLQPAWFKEGWHPRKWKDDTLETPISGWSWAGALVTRASPVGGWDLAKRREKRVRPFVPAGSVFYLESNAGGAFPLEAVWNACVSESPEGEQPTLHSIGYGHALAGAW